MPELSGAMGDDMVGEVAIAKLNEIVAQKMEKAQAKAKEEGKPLAGYYVHTLNKLDSLGLWAGTPVYQNRMRPVTWIAGAIAAYMMVTYGQEFPAHVVTACAVAAYLNYDYYSGVLHVMLDDPRTIAMPFFGQAALEFQWHHEIPTDIVRKDFIDACGDLNAAMFPILGTQIMMSGYGDDKLVLLLGTMKLFMAYFGQFSHRSSHNRNAGVVAKTLQSVGLMISVKDHKDHHRAPFEEDFCLIGVCNPILQAMFNVCGHMHKTWGAIFLFFTIMDNYLLAWAIRAVLQGGHFSAGDMDMANGTHAW